MGIERPDDIDRILDEFDGKGDLDTSGLEDGLLALHDALRACGANPEDENSYRSIVAMAMILASFSSWKWGLAVNELCRCAFRAMRDLKRRGGGS